MDLEQSKAAVIQIIRDVSEGPFHATEDTKLSGPGSSIDSLRILEVCIALESLAEKQGFTFDWTSDQAMARSAMVFQTVASLAQDFATQSKASRSHSGEGPDDQQPLLHHRRPS
jgi:acyl carrier protein